MSEIEQKIKELEDLIEQYNKEYVAECLSIVQDPNYDIYNKKQNAKIDKIANKYAELLLPVKQELNELYEKLYNEKDEEIKKKYIDIN